jgi:hypothetical protein
MGANALVRQLGGSQMWRGGLLDSPNTLRCIACRHHVDGLGMQRIFSQAGLGALDGVRPARGHRSVNQGCGVLCG